MRGVVTSGYVESSLKGHHLIKFSRWDTPLSELVCKEVFSGKSYPILPLLGEVKTIVDIGANVGAATVYFALTYPESRIVAIEPDRDCLELLDKNVAGLPLVETYSVALSDHEGEATLYQGWLDSVMNSLAAHPLSYGTGPTVRVWDALDFLLWKEVESIDILKIDTEGSEPFILRSLAPMLPKVGLIYVEYHSELGRREIDNLLKPTHFLWRARADSLHRGEFCYALPDRIPPEACQPAIVPQPT